MKDAEYFFSETLKLAKKGRGKVSPNPEVGCVVVKNNVILGRGFHNQFGGNHAEVNAILDAEKNNFSVEGSSVFVSLEPCVHSSPSKKTPPCVDLLIRKKIAKVYIFHKDPNPRVLGKGAKKLQNAGIFVFWAEKISPEFFRKNKSFYEKFEFWIQNNIPYTTLKLAQSRDGFLGERGRKIQISGKECRKFTLQERDLHQAILVGANTIIVDNPTLSGEKTDPVRIIIDKNNYFDDKKSQYSVFRDENYFIIHGEKTINEILKVLAQNNISSLFVEGGRETAKKFLDKNYVQRYIQYTSPQNLLNGKDKKERIEEYIKNIRISEYKNMKKQKEFFLGEDIVEIFKKF